MITAFAAALFFAASDPSSRAPPLGIPPALPGWRTVETQYECGGEHVRFSVRYDSEGRGRLVAAQRGSRSLTPADLARLSDSLGALAPLTAVVPQCSREVHVLTGIGRAGSRVAHVLIIWTPTAVNASPPLPPVQGAPPGESLDQAR